MWGEEEEAAKEGGGGGRVKHKQLMPDEGGNKYMLGDGDDDDAAADVAKCNCCKAACEAAAIALARLLLPAKRSQDPNSTMIMSLINIGCSKCSELAYALVANNHNARIMTGRGGVKRRC